MGGVAHQRCAGPASGDLGAVGDAAGDPGAGELADGACVAAPDRLMRKLLMKAEAEAAELQRKLDVRRTDLINSQDKRASTARACQQQEETIRSLEERVKELSSELSTFKAKQEEAEKRSALDSRTAARDHTTALREQTMRANAAEQAKAKVAAAAAAAERRTEEALLNLESTNATAELAVAEARVWRDEALQEVDSSKDARHQLIWGRGSLSAANSVWRHSMTPECIGRRSLGPRLSGRRSLRSRSASQRTASALT